MYSYHNFLFPFRFDKIVKDFNDRHQFYKEYRFEERIVIDEAFKKSLEKDDWEYQKFEVKNHLDYNEFTYFHDFAKDALFNAQDFEKNATSYYFEKQNISNEYNFQIKNGKYYKLKLTTISLRIFDTGVGILSFEVENHSYAELDDILKINEFGRRIYPQFLSDGFSTKDVKNSFLPEYMEVNGTTEHFTQTDFQKIELASFITETLGDIFTTSSDKKDSYFIQPLLDDRMFVLSWYGDTSFSNTLKDDKYIKNDDWYRYIFVDDGKNIYSPKMQETLTKKATYDRWMNNEWGTTLYGMSRYSFVVVTNESDFAQDVLLKHIQTIYFQIVTLLLVQRGSVLRFSDEITAISDIDPDNENFSLNISNLYKHYLRFRNKLYFKEITPQEQGIELYDKAKDVLRVDDDISDLSKEIEFLKSYAFIVAEQQEKEQMKKLTEFGAIFLPGSFVASLFGMNIFSSDFLNSWAFIITPIALVSIVLVTNHFMKINKISLENFLRVNRFANFFLPILGLFSKIKWKKVRKSK